VAPTECLPEARKAAERCIALDPHIADGHSVLGVIRAMLDKDWEGALAALERSVVLDPWEPTARTTLALYGYSPRGRHEEARRHAEHALELDPLSLPCLAYLASVASFGGDHQRAASLCRQALELDPGFVLALWNLLTAREQLGALEEALGLAHRLVAATQGSPVMRAHLARLLARTGRVGQASTLLASLQARALGQADYWYATGWLALGNRPRALEALERAEAARSNFLVFTAVEPSLAGLRSEPRFRALLRRLRLDEVRVG
jgi:adenylate cyclase